MVTVVAGLMLVFAATQLAVAQGGRGGGGFGVLSQIELATLAQVQTELKLNDTQRAKAEEVAEKLRNDRREVFQAGGGGGGDFGAMRERLSKLASDATSQFVSVLDDTQRQRLMGIYLQANGAAVLTDETVAKALQCTDDQHKKIAEVRDANARATREAFQALQGASQEQRREKMTGLRNEMNEKLMAVLTADQRQQFEKLQGAKIELDLSQLRRGGRSGN
jgi:Spy/CpxP family protein refolding chaperone